jgi:hypothetical protein
MNNRRIVAVALLAASAAMAYGANTAKKDSTNEKDCVSYFSSETTDTGLVRLNFRNSCDSPFRIEVFGLDHTRHNSIKPGSPEDPSQGYVLCTQDDECETAKWDYK